MDFYDFHEEFETTSEVNMNVGSDTSITDNSLESNVDRSKFVVTSETINKLRQKPIFKTSFFKLVSKPGDAKVKAQCLMCLPKTKIFTAHLDTTSNFTKHLNTCHKNRLAEYFEAKKKSKIESFVDFNSLETNSCDSFFLKYFVDSMTPFSNVERKSFKNLIWKFQPEANIPTRKKLVQLLDSEYKSSISLTKNILSNVENVCLTADIWSNRKNSYFGMTCHWLDDNFQRHSTALCCKEFSGTHSAEKIGEMFNFVFWEYEISRSKIVAITTDNATNFKKYFSDLCQNEISNSDSDDNDDDDDDNNVDMDALENCESQDLVAEISSFYHHIRCSSHTISLIATHDFDKRIKSCDNLRYLHDATIRKCNLLWRKVNRPKSAETIKNVLGSYLKTPVLTRWNSMYDAIVNLLKHEEKLPILFDKLGLQDGLNEKNIFHLKLYSRLLSHLAQAIDLLQGENEIFYGMLVPTVASLLVKYTKLLLEVPEIYKDLIQTIIQSIKTRFSFLFYINERSEIAILSAALIPAFKLKWLESLKNFGAKYDEADIIKLISKQKIDVPKKKTQKVHEENNLMSFFDFGDSNKTSGAITNEEIETEFRHYLLCEKTELTSLHNFKGIKQLFLKFNCCLPSSAPVERLFSIATWANQNKRRQLSTKNFEKIVILKALNFD